MAVSSLKGVLPSPVISIFRIVLACWRLAVVGLHSGIEFEVRGRTFAPFRQLWNTGKNTNTGRNTASEK